jgi:uncharacterized circularly permuted ATP-grasp superfamily protein
MVTQIASTLNEALLPDGSPASLYTPLLSVADSLGSDELARRWSLAKSLAARDSFTFQTSPSTQNPVPTDWLPRIIPNDDWQRIATGVAQRLKALNRFLADLYCGQQHVVPPDVAFSGRYYRPDLIGVHPPRDVFVHVYGIDLVHLGDGEFAVLEDNLRVPSGIAYQLKALQIGAECLPEFREDYRILPYLIAPAYEALFASLSDADTPNTVLLTDGKGGSAFFEHRYLSDLLGVPLVEGSDLYVDSAHNVFCRTLDGDFPVHVIYRRVEDLEVFVPGLTEAYRRGNVALINSPGAGAADDKLVFLWVPDMVRHYLGEEPVLAQARSYFLQDKDDYRDAMENAPNLVFKTRDGYGGQGVYIMPDLDSRERAAATRRIQETPHAFIAQETLDFSRHLVFDETARDYDERYIDLRVYAVQDGHGKVTVFPGGLTRVATAGSRVTNNSSGGACKETWVVA